MTGVGETFQNIAEAAGTFLAHHDAQTGIVPRLRERDVFGTLPGDGDVADGSVDLTVGRGSDKLTDGAVFDIVGAKTEIGCYGLPKVDRHAREVGPFPFDKGRADMDPHIDH